MKKCGFWDDKRGECDLNTTADCFNCKLYKTQAQINKSRYEAAEKLSKKPFDLRQSIYNTYYIQMTPKEKKMYYVKVWWNENEQR